MAGLREWFSQTDESLTVPRIPVMVSMTTDSVSSKKERKVQETSVRPSSSLDQMHSANRNSVMLDEDSEEDDDYQITEQEQEVSRLHLWSSTYCLFSEHEYLLYAGVLCQS